jgi:pimeloyl-ACP methyl ester carboxylesterase
MFLHGWSSKGSPKTWAIATLGHAVNSPSLSNWRFSKAVRQAQEFLNKHKPDLIVGSSRGGAVALCLETDLPMVLISPAWRFFRVKKLLKSGVIIHSPYDTMIPITNSEELARSSGVELIRAGKDHRMNCEEGKKAILDAVSRYLPPVKPLGLLSIQVPALIYLGRWESFL